MLNNSATRDQIVALHTLYGQWSRHSIATPGDARSARLEWASQNVGRAIASFADLTRDEARQLIDGLKGSMGQPIGSGPQPWRRIQNRDRAQAAGTAGRRNVSSSVIQMASPDDLARIDEAVQRLGWTRDRYQAWINSKYSPKGSGEQVVIRTMAEANRVWWALKAMLRRAGRWHSAGRSQRSGRAAHRS